ARGHGSVWRKAAVVANRALRGPGPFRHDRRLTPVTALRDTALCDCGFAEERLHLGKEIGLRLDAVVGAQGERRFALRRLDRDDDRDLARELLDDSREAANEARGRAPRIDP